MGDTKLTLNVNIQKSSGNARRDACTLRLRSAASCCAEDEWLLLGGTCAAEASGSP